MRSYSALLNDRPHFGHLVRPAYSETTSNSESLELFTLTGLLKMPVARGVSLGAALLLGTVLCTLDSRSHFDSIGVIF